MPVTLVVRKDGATQEILVDGEVSIGRSAENRVVLDSPNVSRRHATLRVDSGVATLVDLGSANGTRFRGAELEPRVPAQLRPGEAFEIGPFNIQVGGGGGASAGVAPASALGGATVVIGDLPAGFGASTEVLLPPTNAKLIVTAPGGRMEVTLDREIMIVGRDPANDIVVPLDVVSRRHFELRRVGSTYVARDLGSVNGIRIGADRVEQHPLVPGDIIDIAGTVQFQFEQEAAPASAPAAQFGQAQEAPLPLGDRAEQLIGRSESCDIQISHPTVSKVHARIVRGSGGVTFIEDLGSTNGTFVDGERLVTGVQRPLKTGDVIFVGPVHFVYSPAALQQYDESRVIGLNAVHLNQRVNESLNLLKDLSFSIRPQEFVAVVGVSGAGKSTLLGALSGLRPASDGQVLLNGTSLYANYGAFRTTLGYVPQDDILHKELPVERALRYAAALRLPDDTTESEQHTRVSTVIDTLGLGERRDTTIARLSGGQRKRVSIGAEMLTSPGLFFLDEATSGLDPGTEKRLMQLLRGLADDGHTIVLITHATQNVMMCDQVAFLAKGGHLAYYGPPEEALPYFEVQSFDGIYEKLEDELSPEIWAERYLRSAQYQRYVLSRLRDDGIELAAPAIPTAQGGDATVLQKRSSSALRQFFILTKRYFDIIRRDRVLFLALFLVAPVLGLVTVAVGGPSVLTPSDGNSGKALTYLFLGSLFPFLIGALLFVREIVKEVPVYTRERSVSLKIWPYLGSKVAVGFLFSLYHAVALLVIQVFIIDFGDIGMPGFFELYLTFVLAIVSGVMWALLISAITGKEEQAMLLVIGVIVLQVVFSGGVVPVSDLGPPGQIVGTVTSTNWAFKAMTSASGVTTEGCEGDFTACSLPGFQGLPDDANPQREYGQVDSAFGDVLDADIYVSWGAMLAIMVGLALAVYFLLKRKDTL